MIWWFENEVVRMMISWWKTNTYKCCLSPAIFIKVPSPFPKLDDQTDFDYNDYQAQIRNIQFFPWAGVMRN